MARRWWRLLAGVAVVGLPATAARADQPAQCHALEIDFTPALDPYEPQIVAWVEDGSGNFIATAFITQQTGRYGLGNRPGRYDYNSGPQWPYGRRVNVFPVWAHRQPNTWPTVDFQLADGSHGCCASDDIENNSRAVSSEEPHYCAPEPPQTPNVDAVTCASVAFTDKGVFDMTTTSLYPPRADLGSGGNEADSASVALYAAMNPFDAVTSATPAGDVPYEITYTLPRALRDGDYVLQVEVSKEFDQNATYSTAAYPAPALPYAAFGAPYRGQPSIVFSLPFALTGSDTVASVLDYAGYGDETGATGTLSPPDATITTDVPGSGPNRLEVVTDGSGNSYRIRIASHAELDTAPPGAPTSVIAIPSSATTATLTFVEPGNDGASDGPVASYQIRVLAGGVIDGSNFATAIPTAASVIPIGPGTVQTVALTSLLPVTRYSVGVRAIDDCGNIGPIQAASFTTPERQGSDVDACFVATAAYGSVMANDVELLRHFRDLVLRRSVLGELFVESYYTFGPPVAGVVGQSELLRESARDALAPVVGALRP